MSTYYNPYKANQQNHYEDCPPLLKEYLYYSETIRGLSPRTVNGYYIDLRIFLKYLKQYRGSGDKNKPLEKLAITDVDLEFLRAVNKAEIYEYLYYATRERDNASAARARKISSLKGFFRYLTSKTGQLMINPMDDIEMPAQKKRLPKYLSLSESVELLNNIQSDFHERDYCIITLFLNCGMRLSELVGINVSDIKEETLRVIGKGNKERIIYLNSACKTAILDLQKALNTMMNLKDKQALFVSKRTGKRLSGRRIQQIVEGCLQSAGLADKGYSVHKLRHTAATLLYQHGQVDMLALQEILGHANVSTTQIYTHLETRQLKEAAASSPLANQKSKAGNRPKREKTESDEKEDVENYVENVDKSGKGK